MILQSIISGSTYFELKVLIADCYLGEPGENLLNVAIGIKAEHF